MCSIFFYATQGAFADFLLTHIATDDNFENETEIIHDLEGIVGTKEVARRRSRLSESDSMGDHVLQRQKSTTSQVNYFFC